MDNGKTVYTTSVIEIDGGLGFVIPSEILKSLNIKVGDELGFELVDDHIVMTPVYKQVQKM